MEIEDIFAKMSAYNFNAPVKVTVSFEDTDEEKSPLAPIKTEMENDNEHENTDPKKLSNDVKVEPMEENVASAENKQSNDNCETANTQKISNEIKVEPVEEKENIADADNKQTTNNDKSCLNVLQDLFGYNNEGRTENGNIGNDNNQSRKRKSEQHAALPSKVREINQNRNNSEKVCNISEVPNIHNGQASIFPLHSQQNPNGTNADSANLKTQATKEPIKVGNYINKLLDTVSRNFILILEAMKVQNGYESSLQKYLRIKEHFFSLSYCTVSTIMLPQESNTAFAYKFLKRTLQFSKRHYPNAQIISLYKEMLQWAKQKQEILNFPLQFDNQQYNTIHNNNDTIINNGTNNDNLLLRQHLSQPLQQITRTNSEFNHRTHNKQKTSELCAKASVPHYNNISNANVNQSHTACIFSTGPPGREISIAVNPTLLKQGNREINTNVNTGKPPSQPKDSKQNQYTQVSPWIARNNYYQQVYYDPTNSQQQVQQQQQVRENYQNSYAAQNVVSSFFAQPLLSSHQPQSSAQPLPSAQPLTSTQQLPSAPPPLPVLPHSAPPPYQEACQWANQNQTPSSQNWNNKQPTHTLQKHPNEQQNQPENTRSLSTDSGFMSPLHFNPVETPSTPVQEDLPSPFAPLITHVTSLNPKAMYISDGHCTVCRKTTKQKCLGCLQSYYCSFACQRADWTLHSLTCRKT